VQLISELIQPAANGHSHLTLHIRQRCHWGQSR